MSSSLAWRNLLHDRLRTIVAILGVAFAVVLVFLQLGFFGAVQKTATIIYDQLAFDLMLRSPDYLHLARSGTVPRLRLSQVLADPEVEAAVPFYIGYAAWRNPESDQRRTALVMAFNPAEQAFRNPEIVDQATLLKVPGQVLMDRSTRPEFGPQETGTETDVGRERLTVMGQFTVGTGFGADGAIVVGDATFRRLLPMRSLEEPSLGLVRLKPGADPRQVAARLRNLLPPDALVLTRDEVDQHEERHWVVKTSVGVIFATGVVVSLIVGMAIVYQVLSSNIRNHLGEYATLKAMGYPDRFLSRLVIDQAVILAVVGYFPGFVLAEWLYALTRGAAHIPIGMTMLRALFVFVSCVVMCTVAGFLSLRKVRTADPAELF